MGITILSGLLSGLNEIMNIKPQDSAWHIEAPPPLLPRSLPVETDIRIGQSRWNWHFYYWWSRWKYIR